MKLYKFSYLFLFVIAILDFYKIKMLKMKKTGSLIIAGLTFFLGSCGSNTGNNATSGAVAQPAASGQAIYNKTCITCHQANGEGLPGAFPPLKGNDVVNDGDATQHVHVVLHGLQGVRVGGVVYGGVMPPFAAALNDTEVADIIDYERSSWGNRGMPAIAAQVAAERAKVK